MATRKKKEAAPVEQNGPTLEQMTEMMDKAKQFDLNLHIYRLLQNEPFFAALSRHITKNATFAIPTAGVMVNKESAQFEMVYNPSFFAQMEEKHIPGVLVHEFYHLIFDHLTSRKPTAPHKAWNIATDLAINSIIGADKLPGFVCMPGGKNFENYPHGLTSEAYLEMLRKDEDKQDLFQPPGEGQGQPGGNDPGNGQFDSHEGWENEGSSPAADMAKERIKDYMSKAANECNKNSSWGSVSQEMREDIMKRLSSKVDWKKLLRAFIGRSQKSDRSNTIRKINKRFPYIQSGRKTNYTANIAIAIDQSGSVSDEMLEMFFGELNKLSTLASFTVVPFDDKVFEKKVYKWEKGAKRKAERVLNGGTSFINLASYINKHSEFEGCIVLTDMCAEKPGPSKAKRMWLTTSACRASMPFQTNEIVATVDYK